MLEGKDSCRHKNGALLPVRNTLERRPESDLGLSEADVAAKESVHRIRLLHIVFNLVHGDKLIVRFFKFKSALKVVLHIKIFRKRKSFCTQPLCVYFCKLGRHVLDSRTHA